MFFKYCRTQKKRHTLKYVFFFGTRGTRTPNLLLRRQLLYPDELWSHFFLSYTGFEPVTHALKGRCSTYWASSPTINVVLQYRFLWKMSIGRQKKKGLHTLKSLFLRIFRYSYLWNEIDRAAFRFGFAPGSRPNSLPKIAASTWNTPSFNPTPADK